MAAGRSTNQLINPLLNSSDSNCIWISSHKNSRANKYETQVFFRTRRDIDLTFLLNIVFWLQQHPGQGKLWTAEPQAALPCNPIDGQSGSSQGDSSFPPISRNLKLKMLKANKCQSSVFHICSLDTQKIIFIKIKIRFAS